MLLSPLGAELQMEVENLALRLHYVNNAKEDVRSDIAVMKRAAERADVEVVSAEAAKHKQVSSPHDSVRFRVTLGDFV